MIIERILLQTIKFDLQLTHPYSYLIKFGKLLKGNTELFNTLFLRFDNPFDRHLVWTNFF